MKLYGSKNGLICCRDLYWTGSFVWDSHACPIREKWYIYEILITGVTTGFGKTTLDYLSKKGHVVYGTTRDRQKYLEINGNSNYSEILEVDLTSDESVLEAVSHIIDKEGRIDVLVNNAGFGIGGPINDTLVEHAQDLFKVNFFAVLRIIQAVLPHFINFGCFPKGNTISMVRILKRSV